MRYLATALQCATVFALLISMTSTTIRAQSIAAAQATLIDPSIRASGMGRASGAVFWGFDTNDWANPALLSYRQGIGYEYGRTRLVPSLADDVYFTTSRFFAGLWGVQFVSAGTPIGKAELNYGTSVAVGDDEVELGEFESFETMDSWGVGVSVGTLAASVIRQLSGNTVPIARFGDVSFGYTSKDVHVSLAPAWATEDGRAGEGDATNEDTGLLVRASPLALVQALVPGVNDAIDKAVTGVEVDVAYASSRQNKNDVSIDEGQWEPMGRLDRDSWAGRVAIGAPRTLQRSLSQSGLGWLALGMDPVFQIGYVEDRIKPSVPMTDGSRFHSRHIDGYGWEITVANIFSYRWGHIDDPEGTIVDDTSGWGVRLPISDFASVQYDRATVPQSSFLDEDVTRNGFMMRVDVERVLARYLR